MMLFGSHRPRPRPVGLVRLLLLLVGALPSVVQGQFQYATNSGGITITYYSGSGGAVTIPGMISGLPVTSIANLSFNSSFSLTSVTIPNSVTNIGGQAFGNCNKLTGVTIPNGVISIGSQAFYNCTSLTNVTIPASVTNIGASPFEACPLVAAITVNSTNMYYSSANGVLFDKNQTVLLEFPGGFAGPYTIPSSVTNIGDAFESCTKVTGVTIPNGVTNIADLAFLGCTSLASIVIPSSVLSIGQEAFFNCASLTSATIGSGVSSIGVQAFSGSGLTSITIPSSVTNIGNSAFGSCGLLTAITVDPGNPYYSGANGVVFNKSQTALVAFPAGLGGSYTIPNSVTSIGVAFESCTRVTSVTIPTSVTSIPDSAFYDCSSLASVTIPNSVTNIGFNAFGSCNSLTNIAIPGSVTFLGTPAFANCIRLSGVYFGGNSLTGPQAISSSATVYYLPGTTGWSNSFGGRPTVLWNPAIQSDASFGLKSNQFGFNITGTANIVFVVDSCTSLVNPVWSPLQTVTLGSGLFYFSDALWTNYPGRFYRIRSP